jgi:hypothetical protein
MALQKHDPVVLTLTVAIDGEQADIDIDTSKTVGELIQHALVAHAVDEDADACHLAGPDRLYFPQQRLADLGFDNGAMLSLRLPF